MRRFWTKQEEQKVAELHKQGKSLAEIAEAVDRSYTAVSIKLGRKIIPLSESPMPKFDKPLVTQGDAVILSDIEAPFQNSDFINRVIDLADAWNIRTLHLAGDLLHYDSLSAWGSEWTEADERIQETLDQILLLVDGKKRTQAVKLLEDSDLISNNTFSGEMKSAREVFKNFNNFEKIVVALGNHDDRYLRALDQAVSPKELLHQLDRHNDPRWKIAPYYYTLIETEKGMFRASHPRGAGKNTAIDLAVQFHQHVIMGHSHRWSVNRDPSGKYWAIQTGHCVDELRLAYVQQRDAKRDAHINGATIIRGGYPFVLCPDSPFEIMKRM